MQNLTTPPEIMDLIEHMQQGDRRSLARLITKIETGGPDLAKHIIKKIYSNTGKAYIIGITGAPGSGKSTLTNQLATHYLKQGKKVSIVAVDPSSPFSGGALLGDRIRMKENFRNKNLFIRSMANRGQLGGLAISTKDVISVLDAYGSDVILVETVGVGQSEIDIFKAAHTTLVVVVPGMGDGIQAIKAGIMEITDIFVVNKCDYDGADKRVSEIESMLDFSEKIEVSQPKDRIRIITSEGWRPPVIKTNAVSGENIGQLVKSIENHSQFLENSGMKIKKLIFRYKHYSLEILKYVLSKNIEKILFSNPEIDEFIENILLRKEGADPYTISDELLQKYLVNHL